MADRIPDSTAEQVADEAIGPVLDGPVQLAYGPFVCRCGCGSTRSALNAALDFAEGGMSPRDAVDSVRVHYGLDEAQVDALVEDVEELSR